MTEQTTNNDQQEPSRTTYTTVTYTKLDTGLSITISETITITNANDKSPIHNKNYELILVPSIENTKTIVVPTGETNDKSASSQVSPPLPPPPPLLPPPPLPSPPPPPPPTTTTAAAAITATTTRVTKSPSHHQFLHPPRHAKESNFAYIDESSDDRTFSSGDVLSTLDDLTTRDSSTTSSSSSTLSLSDQPILNSTSTLVNNRTPSSKETSNRVLTTTNNHQIMKPKNESSEEKYPYPTRPTFNPYQRQRRAAASLQKTQRRLLQYELMPTGKVYYIDRPFYKDYHPGEQDENSSAILSTVLSRSSSLDTLSEKHARHRRQQQQQPQNQNQKIYHDLSLKKNEQKASIGGRLASNTNLPQSTSTFKPISSAKKKRFSSFDPTPESLDRVFDVIIAADKRREEHEFWKEKFVDQRPPNSRAPSASNRLSTDLTNTNTIPVLRSKQTQLNSNTLSSNPDRRSQSYTNKRTSSYEPSNPPCSNLLDDCLRRRSQLLQQQRNYSPNAIYSTNYPKQQHLFPATKPPIPPSIINQPPVRILPLSNGRVGRAPQARQTSDELSSVSDVWAARSSIEDASSHQPKKLPNHTRFQSTVNRSRLTDSKPTVNKRASSVEQDKSTRTQTKQFSATKNKFFDLFKFNR